MADLITQRSTVEIEGPFVVFLIGMRINKLWKIHQWLPVSLAMPRMLKELSEDPESGLLGFRVQPGLRNIMVCTVLALSGAFAEVCARSKPFSYSSLGVFC